MNERVTMSKNGRLVEATRLLQEGGLDGLIAASNGLNNFLESNAVYVLSGVRPIGESAVVLDREGSSTLIVTPAWDGERAASLSSTDATIATDDLGAALKTAVGKHRLEVSRSLSVGLSLLGHGLVDRIGTALGALPKAADELVRDLARVRTAEELEAAERATWIAERGYERLLEYARPGLREYELAAELYCFTKKLGAEDNFLLMSASQHNLAVRAAGERILDVGDIILSEITPCYRGQFAQICRTTAIGEPRPPVREKYAILQDAMRAGLAAGRAAAALAALIAAVRPGTRTAELYAKATDALAPFPLHPVLGASIGHGIGLSLNEQPEFRAPADAALVEDGVYTLQVGIADANAGNALLSAVVRNTAKGAEVLARSPPLSL